MSIEERHATMSWGEGREEPPYPGKVHRMLVDTEAERWGEGYHPICGMSSRDGSDWYCDVVDAPVTCGRCLRAKPETIERLRKEIEKGALRVQ